MVNKEPETGRNASSAPGPFTSNALRLFIETVEDVAGAAVLDLGPVCGENINFLSCRVCKLYVCDFYRELSRNLDTGDAWDRVWRHLDYPPGSFNGVLLWDLVNRFKDQEAIKLVERCRKMVKPGGHVVVFASNEDAESKTVNSFVIGNGYKVCFRPQRHLRLPVKNRQNRDILEIMKPFIQIRSFIYRNGIREFLFRVS